MAKPTGQPNGRPTVQTPEIVEEICERLAAGESLRSICRDDDMPALSTVTLWIVRNRGDFSEHYARAREAQGYTHADRIVHWAYELEDREDAPNPQAAKVAIDALKWAAERMAPKANAPKQDTTQPPPTVEEQAETEARRNRITKALEERETLQARVAELEAQLKAQDE